MPGNAIIGSQDFRPNINLANYFPKENDPNKPAFNDVLKSADISTFTKSHTSPLEKDIKKTVDGIQQMVLAYVKGRVPLGDDKFNTTDMLRSMLDMLNATGNMQRAAMQEDGNKMALQQLCVLMSQQVGRDALVKDNTVNFKGKSMDIAVEMPENESIVNIAIQSPTGEVIRSWQMSDQPGIQYLHWDGRNDQGEAVEQTSYTVHAISQNEEGQSTIVPLYVPKKIEELRFDPSANGKFPVYYSGNQPIRNMLSVYSGSGTPVTPGTTVVDEAV